MIENDEYPETALCECNGFGVFMGFLGNTGWFRCRKCGLEFSREDAEEE